MPVVINQGGSSGGSAGGPRTSKGPLNAEAKKARLLIGFVAVAILLCGYMFYTYILSDAFRGTKPLTKVAPLPGMRDVWPYNTKEWQENYKKTGQMPLLSGVPRFEQGGAQAPGAVQPPGGQAQTPANNTGGTQ